MSDTTLSKQSALHLKQVYFGGNWTFSNMKDQLSDVSWEEATTKLQDLNSIAVLTFHIAYYVNAQLEVFKGNPLNAHDKYSFDLEPITSREQWEQMLSDIWDKSNQLIEHIEKMSDEQFFQNFTDEKYGNYFRNIHGMIEHTHYHLGQIAIIKKMIRNKA